MEIASRKKLLTKKYFEDAFTEEEANVFATLGAAEIIALLKDNPYLRTCANFFRKLQLNQIEKILSTVFEPDEKVVRLEVLSFLVTILKQSTILLEMCFEDDDFNYMSIFGFLEEEHISYPSLVLFEDILLPYVRKIPVKIMEILAEDDHVQAIMMRRIYEKPIFKIIYTLIFCLSKKQSETFKEEIHSTIAELLETPFLYLDTKEKKMFEKQLSSSMNIELGKKSPEKALHFSANLTEKTDNESSQKISVTFKKVKNQSIEKFGNVQAKAQQCPTDSTVDQIGGESTKNKTSIDYESEQPQGGKNWSKNMPLNEDLDFADLAYNMKELFTDLAINIESIYLKNVLILFEIFNKSYLEKILLYCQKFHQSEDHEIYCEGIIRILISVIELFTASMKSMVSITCINETEDQRKALNHKLQARVCLIASKIPFFVEFILKDNEKQHLFSSGEKVKKVGVIKYRMLEIIVKLLELNESVDLNIEFDDFDLMKIVQKYLLNVRWNNIVHQLLIKLTELALDQDYEGFRERYIEIETPKNGFIGTLVESFYNKKLVYLSNMKFSNYGNTSVLYRISRIIIKAVTDEKDLPELIEKFPSLETFIGKNLPIYQKMLQDSQYFDSSQFVEPETHVIKCVLTPDHKHINEPLETIQEIVGHLEDIKRWSAPQRKKSRRRKDSLLKLEITSQIDSLKCFSDDVD